MNFIYITTNNTNGKQYVGSHNGEIDDRYLGSGKLLLRAIKLYGRHNFTRQIIQECDPIDNLILEERYIKQYSTIQPNGYNISPTGGHGLNGKLSEKTKEKLRKPKSESAKMNMSLGKRGIEFSDEHRKNISASKSGKNHPNWGKHVSEETKNRIRISNLGQKRTEEQKRKWEGQRDLLCQKLPNN
jgi:group I intron endonuclease